MAVAPNLGQELRRVGGADGLPEISGPHLDRFDPRHLARALENEVVRARLNGWPKISLHMDVDDALLLARVLSVR